MKWYLNGWIPYITQGLLIGILILQKFIIKYYYCETFGPFHKCGCSLILCKNFNANSREKKNRVNTKSTLLWCTVCNMCTSYHQGTDCNHSLSKRSTLVYQLIKLSIGFREQVLSLWLQSNLPPQTSVIWQRWEEGELYEVAKQNPVKAKMVMDCNEKMS